jgi:phosphatidylserine/phosphatidylglycerophosphate/cardiolipin synthase-like enzyme
MSIVIKAFANSDHALIVWRSDATIANCVGFAIFKKSNREPDALATPLNNRIPFAGDAFTPGEQQPSTEWPIQRFSWSDFSVQQGDSIQYMLVPMLLVGGQLQKDAANVSPWSDAVNIGTGTTYMSFFNRGIISSQFVANGLKNVKDQANNTAATVNSVVTGPASPLRDLLGGSLSAELFSILDGVIADTSTSIYCVLYELNQEDLIDKLIQIGNRANVILANGTGKTPGTKAATATGDENVAARAALKGKVNLHDRIVNASEHFAHNKYLVVCDKNGDAQKVFTGSTNWTSNGLFAQVNNGLLINDADYATFFLDEWKQLLAAGNAYPAPLISYNKAAFGTKPRVWFATTSDFADLADANAIINNAQNGVLFLMFNPGPKNTLFNTILALQASAKGPNLFVHGVINQDPGTKGNNLILFHQGTSKTANWDDIIAKNIQAPNSFWTKEPKEMVTIHSKIVVVDPFGANPVVMTGSHNMGPRASSHNDDNLNLIFDAALAKEYAVNILAIYDHYRWRYSVYNKANNFTGLANTGTWMQNYNIDPVETKFYGF